VTTLRERVRWHTTARRLRRASQPAAGAILLYHRVATGDDPLELNVSPENFAGQMEVVRSAATPVALGELRAGSRRVAVTFDDGYRDNLTTAEPILNAAGVPATVFVTSGPVDDGRELWWDELVRLGAAEAFERLRRLTPAERERELATLRQGPPGQVEHPLLAPDEVATLAASPAIEVGAHTVTHPMLSALPAAAQQCEIVESRRRVAELAGVAVMTFAYPFGTPLDYDNTSVRLVREAGFALACANIASPVGARSPQYELPRLLVRDWSPEEFERRLESVL
jgi:peptidoglycan/xylan/chitin deacetylase (PgdA/CDA1 family)